MNVTTALAALIGSSALSGCTCAASHTIDASSPDADAHRDGTTLDSSMDDVAPDAGCDSWPPQFPGVLSCDEESEAVCITWAQQLWSGEGEVHVTCEVTFAGSVRCSNGDYCPEPDPSGPPGGCQCAPGVVCDFDDVCVSDPPDGERRCVPKCS
jgi:hypothetical protein